MCCDVLCVDFLGFCVALEHSDNIEIAAHGLRHNKLCPPPHHTKTGMCVHVYV